VPAKSEKQRRLMAAARAYKRGEYKGEPSEEVKRLAAEMTDKELTDFMKKEAAIDALKQMFRIGEPDTGSVRLTPEQRERLTAMGQNPDDWESHIEEHGEEGWKEVEKMLEAEAAANELGLYSYIPDTKDMVVTKEARDILAKQAQGLDKAVWDTTKVAGGFANAFSRRLAEALANRKKKAKQFHDKAVVQPGLGIIRSGVQRGAGKAVKQMKEKGVPMSVTINKEGRERLNTLLDQMLEKQAAKHCTKRNKSTRAEMRAKYAKKIKKDSMQKQAEENFGAPNIPEDAYERVDAAVAQLQKEAVDWGRVARKGGQFVGDYFGKSKPEKLGTLASLLAGGGAGYAHYRLQPEDKKNPIYPAVTALGTAWSLKPSYIKSTLRNIKRAKMLDAEQQWPAVRALGTSALLTGGSLGVEKSIASIKDLSEGIESLKNTAKSLEVDPEKGGKDINEITNAIASAAEGMAPKKDPSDPKGERVITPAEQFGTKLAEGFTKEMKEKLKAGRKWAGENKLQLAGGAAGLTGLYMLMKYLSYRNRRAQKEEEAKIQAKEMSRALGKALKDM